MVYFRTYLGTFVKFAMNPALTMTAIAIPCPFTMDLAAKLIALRKAKGLTQQEMADLAELHVNQIKRYEVGTTLPSLEAIKRIATTFHVSVDALLFDEGERGPDEELRLQFEAVAQFDAEEKQAVKSLIEGMILKHQARQLLQLARPTPSRAPAATKARRGRPAQRAARS